jgi:hypothetical protein
MKTIGAVQSCDVHKVLMCGVCTRIWDVKNIQGIRRKDSDKMVQSFHEVVS